MANTVNVTNTNTFEQWRVKGNEVGTAVGDLDNLTSGNTGETNVVSALTTLKTNTDTNTTNIGTIGSLATSASDLVAAVNEVHTEVNSNDTDIAATNANIGTIGSLATAASDLVAALNEIHTETNTNTSGISSNDTDISSINSDIGTWSGYSGSSADITTAINAIENVQGNLASNYVDASGDTMTGALIAGGGVFAASGNYLNLGVDSVNTIRINSSNRVGVGKAAHTSYKVDVSGDLNATNLRIGGEELDDRYMQASTSGGTTTITDVTDFTNDITMSKTLTLGNETIYDVSAGSGFTFTENIQDIAGAMFSGSETGGISAVYSDSTGTITLNIADDGHNHIWSNIDGADEQVQDIAGAMWTSNTESGVSVTYDDSDGTLDINVNDPTITLTSDVTGSGVLTNLGNLSFATSIKSSVALGGNPTITSTILATSDDSNKVATTALVQNKIDALIGGAPGALDTLKELADNFDSTVTSSYAASIVTSLGGKVGTSSSQALSTNSNAMTISGHTITLARADGTTDTVEVPDYSHPTHPGDVFSVDTGALSGAYVVSDIDINVTTDTLGHVTDADASVSTRQLTLGDLGYTGATDANNITDNNQLNNGAGYVTSSGNTIIGTDSDVDTSGADVIDQLNMTDGVIQSHSTRTLTLGDLGYTGATDANNITDNNQLNNGAGYITSAGAPTPGVSDVIVDGSTSSGKTIYINTSAPGSSTGTTGDVWFEY